MMGFSAASDATNDSAILDENLIVAQELNEKKEKGTVEIESLREFDTKHYQLASGGYVAISSGTALHRKNKNGDWIDINNRLTLSKGVYQSEDGYLSFASSLQGSGQIFSLADQNKEITMSFLSTGKYQSEATVSNHSVKEALSPSASKDDLSLWLSSGSNTTTVCYYDVLDNVDLQYEISGNDVKEIIVLNQMTEENGLFIGYYGHIYEPATLYKIVEDFKTPVIALLGRYNEEEVRISGHAIVIHRGFEIEENGEVVNYYFHIYDPKDSITPETEILFYNEVVSRPHEEDSNHNWKWECVITFNFGSLQDDLIQWTHAPELPES